MNIPRTFLKFTAAILAFCALGAGIARAQYIITGTNASGGFIITGSGTSLGALSGATTPALSGSGYNNVTLEAGSFANSGSFGGTITFDTSNNTLVVDGTVTNSNYGAAVKYTGTTSADSGQTVTISAGGSILGSSQGYSGLDFEASGSFPNISNLLITNAGLVAGGSGEGSGAGIEINSSNGNISGVTVVNSGTISGGSGEYDGGDAIYINTNSGSGVISNITVSNTTTITGGSGEYGGGAALYINSDGSISGVTVTNSGTMSGGTQQDAIYINTQSGGISNVSVGNTGLLQGGSGEYGGGAGIYISSNGSIGGVTVTNSGTINAGTQQDAIYINTQSGGVSNVSVNNTGLLQGGSGEYGGGSGVYISADGSMSEVTVTDSGTMRAGTEQDAIYLNTEGGGMTSVAITDSGLLQGGSGEYGAGAAIYLSSGGTMSNVSVTVTSNGQALSGVAEDGQDAIYINSEQAMSGVSVADSGLVQGGAGSYGGGSAIYISSNGTMSNVSVAVSGRALAGSGGYEAGVYINSGGPMSGLSVAVSGTVAGSSGGSDGGEGLYISSNTDLDSGTVAVAKSGVITGGSSGFAGSGINIGTDGNLNSFTLSNSGFVSGGASAGFGGEGINISADGNMTGMQFTNSGTVIGTGSSYGETAVNVDAQNIQSSTFVNTGVVTGGGGSSESGEGIDFFADGTMAGVFVKNTGTVTGGSGALYGSAALLIDGENSITGVTVVNSGLLAGGSGGSETGSGIGITSESINGLTVTNSGQVTSGSTSSGEGAPAILISSENLLANTQVTNSGTAISSGSNGAGIAVESGQSMSNVQVVNSGLAQGGPGGVGIMLESGFGVTNTLSSLTNSGSVAGGSGAAGVYLHGNDLVLNNEGSIAGGAGGASIDVSGSDNTVYLMGHSTVSGSIAATGSANNTLVLNFSGMSPAQQALLKAQLQAQGDLNNFSGTFTVRGVTYIVDPMAIKLQLQSYQLQGLTPNQASIGASLDSLATNPPMGSPLYNLYNAIDRSGNVPAALEALSPVKYAIYGDLAIQNTASLVQDLDRRLNNVRDGSESVDTSGMGGDTVAAVVTGDPSKDGSKDGKGVVQTEPKENRWGFFASGDGLFYRDGSQGKANTAGTLWGVDGKAGEHGVIGTFFAYNNAAASLGGPGSNATVESYSGGLYGSWHNDGYYVNSLAAYTRNDYSSNRSIAFPGFALGAAGNTNGNQESVNLDGGYDWHLTDRVTLGPIAGLQYVHLDVDGFNESGAGAASLAVGSQSVDSLQSRVGARAAYHIATSSHSSAGAELYTAWQHEYLDDSRGIGGTFEGGGLAPFSVQTASPNRDAAVVGAAVNFSFRNRLTLFADYELQMWQSNDFEQSINGGAKISW